MPLTIRLAYLSVVALGLTISLAGCGAQYNAKSAQTNTDGSPSKLENFRPAISSEDAFKAMQKSDPSKTKGDQK